MEDEVFYDMQMKGNIATLWLFFTEKGLDAEASYFDQPLPLLICVGLVLKVTMTVPWVGLQWNNGYFVP